jgi:hypothetical protein
VVIHELINQCKQGAWTMPLRFAHQLYTVTRLKSSYKKTLSSEQNYSPRSIDLSQYACARTGPPVKDQSRSKRHTEKTSEMTQCRYLLKERIPFRWWCHSVDLSLAGDADVGRERYESCHGKPLLYQYPTGIARKTKQPQ